MLCVFLKSWLGPWLQFWAGLGSRALLWLDSKTAAPVFTSGVLCFSAKRYETNASPLEEEAQSVRVEVSRVLGFTVELIFMAKRRAEDNLLHDSPSKRRYRSLYSVDMQLHSVARSGGLSLSPPSLMALVGSRCRKRPRYFEDTDKEAQEAAAGFYYKTTHCDTRKHEANVLTVQTSGSFQESRISGTFTNHKKRQREDCVCANTATTKAKELVSYWLNSRSPQFVRSVVRREVNGVVSANVH